MTETFEIRDYMSVQPYVYANSYVKLKLSEKNEKKRHLLAQVSFLNL